MKIVLWPLLAACLFCHPLHAQPTPDNTSLQNQLQQQARADNLANHPTWLALMYYQANTWGQGKTSEVDDKRFFLTPQGETDSGAELQAAIQALLTPPTRLIDNEHPRCLFPARFYWLQQQLRVAPQNIPALECQAFEKWRNEINAAGASVIFPAAYLDSPSSMFGHTLIRLDRATDAKTTAESDRLLSYTVSYAAQKKPEDSELIFVYRGLVGGYPGETSLRPYYQKLREYSDIESRDIWEYQLNLTQEETEQLVRHTWEIQAMNFDYYFFTENCSYRVLAMLDVLRPEQRMVNEYSTHVIPVDTVRSLLANGWVENVEYQPSIITRFNHMLSQLKPQEQQQALSLVVNTKDNLPELATQDASTQQVLLDTAYQYSRLTRQVETPGKSSYDLLLARQKIPGKSALSDVPTPRQRVDEGHASGYIALSRGEDDNTGFTEIQLRPAYHGMTAGALAASGNLTPKSAGSHGRDVHFLPYPYAFRCPFGTNGSATDQLSINYIRTVLSDPESGITKPAAVIVEVVQGEGEAGRQESIAYGLYRCGERRVCVLGRRA